MSDEDYIDRKGAKHEDGFVPRGDEDGHGYTSGRIFAVSFTVSLSVVLAILVLTFTGMAIPATFSNVGGLQVEIGEIRGSDVGLYPGVGESSNCIWEPEVENPTDPADRALPLLAADIGDAEVPSAYGVSFRKDIDLPDQFLPGLNDVAWSVQVERDPDVVPDEVDTSPYSAPPQPTSSGHFIRSFELGPTDSDLAELADPLREATAADFSSGYRDLTQAKIFLVQDEEYEFEVTMRVINELSNFDLDDAAVAAFIDWDQDEFLSSTGDENIPIGGVDDPTGDGLEEVEEEFIVPGDAETGETLMRVVMESGESDPDNIDPDGSISNGITEEYTVVVVESEDDIPVPAEVGDTTLRVSDLRAEFLDLRSGTLTSDFLLDDRISDPTDPDEPIFTRDGELILEAVSGSGDQNAKIRNAEGQLHSASLGSLQLSLLDVSTQIIDEEDALIATEDCGLTDPQFIPDITTIDGQDVEEDVPSVDTGQNDVVVEALVTNPGDEAETQDLTFTFDPGGTFEDSETRFSETIDAGTTQQYASGGDEPPFEFDAPGAGNEDIYEIELNPEDDEPDTEQVVVGDPADFQVTILDLIPEDAPSDEVIAEREELTVQYEIDNIGDVEALGGGKQVDLLIDGEVVESEVRQVDGGDDDIFEFDFVPGNINAGDPVDVTVQTEDDSDTDQITIWEAPFFDVEITNINEPVDADDGEDLEVDIDITNTGQGPDTQDIELEVFNARGQFVGDDSDSVSLDSRQSEDSESIQLTQELDPEQDVPTVDAIVSSDDDQVVEENIEVEGVGAVYQIFEPNTAEPDPDNLGADISPTTVRPDEVDSAESGFTAEFDIFNVGTEDPEGDGEDVELVVIDDEGNFDRIEDVATDVDIPVGESKTFDGSDRPALQGTAVLDDLPEFEAQVRTEVDTEDELIDVEEPPGFVIDDIELTPDAELPGAEQLVEGEDLTFEIDVENQGEFTADADVFVEIDTNQDGTYDEFAGQETDVTIDNGDDETVEIDYTTQSGDGGSEIEDGIDAQITVNRAADNVQTDDETVDDIQVLTPAVYEVEILEDTMSPDDPRAGQDTTSVNDPTEDVSIDIEVENMGQATGEQDITLECIDCQGFGVDDTEEDFNVPGGETSSVTLDWETDVGFNTIMEDGSLTTDVTLEAESDDDSDTSDTIEVERPVAEGTVSADSTDLEAGESTTVTVDIDDITRGVDDEQTFVLRSEQGDGMNRIQPDNDFPSPGDSGDGDFVTINSRDGSGSFNITTDCNGEPGDTDEDGETFTFQVAGPYSDDLDDGGERYTPEDVDGEGRTVDTVDITINTNEGKGGPCS